MDLMNVVEEASRIKLSRQAAATILRRVAEGGEGCSCSFPSGLSYQDIGWALHAIISNSRSRTSERKRRQDPLNEITKGWNAAEHQLQERLHASDSLSRRWAWRTRLWEKVPAPVK